MSRLPDARVAIPKCQPRTRRQSRAMRRSRRGNVLVLSAVLMIPLMGMVALSVDVGYLLWNQTRLQAAADAAALAAANTMSEGVDSDSYDIGVNYANLNFPPADEEPTEEEINEITFGSWDPETRQFNTQDPQPNAVQVVLQRPASLFFARVLGQDKELISASAIAAGPAYNYYGWNSVYVTSTKDLSNVVLAFDDGVHQKFEDLSGYSGTFSGTGDNANKSIATVWIKSGPNASGDGPGYGERFDNPQHSQPIHGAPASGPQPHCTATFYATGPEYSDSGSASPYRLVD